MCVTSMPTLAQIDLSDFTDALDTLVTAVNAELGGVVTAGLGIAGVIIGGLILWRLFRRIVSG